ncbi:ABC transporter ATP-binding protein [Streptomyces sparsogenes]|uniref:ABC transporter-like protein n=1 Tax=Streptomyces sparsogenes DSM 40356 TaxID=1331668 RepID=A0A1R1SCW0_9ACTN|nr:ABC transporter ATP-binding protein [Streptomyces sparsogenes]OMI35879.1 ABC transporter-like protein [Streptomyces sparsogenes DSM 40356]
MSGPTGIAWRARTALVLEVAGAVATVGPLVAVVEVCRELLADDPDGARLGRLVLVVAAAAVAGFVCQLVGRVLSKQAGVRTQQALLLAVTGRLRGARAARPLHAAWKEHGTTLGRDIASVGVMVGRAGSELIAAALVFALSIGYLFWVDWLMALITLAPILLGFAAFGVISVRFFREMATDYAASIGGIDAVRPTIELQRRVNPAGSRAHTATATRRSARRLADVTDEFSEFFRVRIGSLLGGRALAEIAFSPLTVLVFVLCGGALLIRSDRLAPADLVPFLLLGAGLAAPLLAITYFLEEVGEGKKAAARLVQFTTGSAPSRPAAATGATDVPADAGTDTGTGTDTDTSTDADAGPVLVLPERGVLTVVATTEQGADAVIDRITADTPAERFAAVEADPAVVIGPIGAYITADRADGGAEEAERAARLAGCHASIAVLPRGYDAVVGTEAPRSYPETQRLALARLLAADREVVLLDQRAFPGDPDTLRAAVAELRERAAVVVVATGPPAVAEGRLVVTDAGQVVASGTHEELAGPDSPYAGLLGPAGHSRRDAGAAAWSTASAGVPASQEVSR